MADVTTRTLRNYLASLPSGVSSGVVDQQLEIRNDLAPATQALPVGGTTGQVLAKVSSTSFDVAWTTAGVGDMLKVTYDPQGKNADAFARANQTGTQPYTTITGLGDIVTHNVSEFATSAQGGRADTGARECTPAFAVSVVILISGKSALGNVLIVHMNRKIRLLDG